MYLFAYPPYNSNVGEADYEVTFDVINEDPSRPGPIGYAKVELQKLFTNPRFEDWVPLASMTGGPLGHLYVRMNFTVSALYFSFAW